MTPLTIDDFMKVTITPDGSPIGVPYLVHQFEHGQKLFDIWITLDAQGYTVTAKNLTDDLLVLQRRVPLWLDALPAATACKHFILTSTSILETPIV